MTAEWIRCYHHHLYIYIYIYYPAQFSPLILFCFPPFCLVVSLFFRFVIFVVALFSIHIFQTCYKKGPEVFQIYGCSDICILSKNIFASVECCAFSYPMPFDPFSPSRFLLVDAPLHSEEHYIAVFAFLPLPLYAFSR
uniref:Uncharacterized protein n=1 Tax=Trypanosoma congolense (strain IL3000) TaxID=1068625 RepID=F9W9D1_TRYCI|nr:hypothetical protein, unlikely [Trypanosoma congolense IL3000]